VAEGSDNAVEGAVLHDLRAEGTVHEAKRDRRTYFKKMRGREGELGLEGGLK
jgi:hypothetical protein